MNIRDRFDKFTERAKRVLVLAQEEARLLQHSYLGTEHLLLGLLREGDGVAAKVLQTCALDLEKLRSTTEEVVGRGDRVETGEIKMTADTRRAIELAIEQAQRMNHQYIGTEHLLLGLLRLPECDVTEILQNQGISLEMIRVRTLRMLKAMAASYGELGKLIRSGGWALPKSKQRHSELCPVPRCRRPPCRSPQESVLTDLLSGPERCCRWRRKRRSASSITILEQSTCFWDWCAKVKGSPPVSCLGWVLS